MVAAVTFQAIQSLFHAHKLEKCKGGTLRVREADKKATLQSINIDSVGASAFFIQYDECKFPGAWSFAPHESLHRACDAIAFCEVDGNPYIMCIELKSTEPDRTEVAQQLRSAHCFLDYLTSIIEAYFKCDSIRHWPRRYFVFHDQGATPLFKGVSRDEYNNTSPESALFISTHTNAKILVRKLLGKEV